MFDAFYNFAFIILNSIFNLGLNWLKNPKLKDYITFIILGIICAVIIEWGSYTFNLWSYNQNMPQIFGIGIIPLIELALTSIFSLLFAPKLRLKN